MAIPKYMMVNRAKMKGLDEADEELEGLPDESPKARRRSAAVAG